jgi:hypothetical protein
MYISATSSFMIELDITALVLLGLLWLYYTIYSVLLCDTVCCCTDGNEVRCMEACCHNLNNPCDCLRNSFDSHSVQPILNYQLVHTMV